MKKLIVAFLCILISNFSQAQAIQALRVEFNSISTVGEVVDEDLFRNDSLVIVNNPGNKLAVYSFEVSSDQQSAAATSIRITGNRLTPEAKAQIRSLIASGNRTFKISDIKLLYATTESIEDYVQTLSFKVVFN
jgi:hypothetical protein